MEIQINFVPFPIFPFSFKHFCLYECTTDVQLVFWNNPGKRKYSNMLCTLKKEKWHHCFLDATYHHEHFKSQSHIYFLFRSAFSSRDFLRPPTRVKLVPSLYLKL